MLHRSAHISLVINGELHTPSPDCFLNGITRRSVIALAKKRGLKVVEVTPVGEIIGYCGHHCFTSGTICWLMWEDYDREVGKKVASAA